MLASSFVFAQDDKNGRTVQINGESIAIDASTTQKGEGIRYYLEKDPIALEYLNQYAQTNKPNWKRIAVSTFGVGLILGSIIASNETDNIFLKRDTLLYSGLGIVALSFIFAKTKQGEQEIYLNQAIQEYNKRNKPEIIWSPQYHPENKSFGIFIGREY